MKLMIYIGNFTLNDELMLFCYQIMNGESKDNFLYETAIDLFDYLVYLIITAKRLNFFLKIVLNFINFAINNIL